MTFQLALAYAAVWLVLFQALLVRAQLVTRSCHRCGRPFERRELGQAVCGCGS
jgi:hypothetical protein